MNTQPTPAHQVLETAKLSLQDVLDETFRSEANAEAATLDRMLVHLKNMDAAIEAAPDVQANIVKRLGDFAVTASRMAVHNLAAAPKLTRLADVLRAASQRLREWNGSQQPAT